MSSAIGYNPFTNAVVLSNGEEMSMIEWIKFWEWQHKHYQDLMLAKDFIDRRYAKSSNGDKYMKEQKNGITDIQAGDVLRTHVEGAELIGGSPYYDITLIEKDGRIMADSSSVTDRLTEKWASDSSTIFYVENLRTKEEYRPAKSSNGDQ